MLSGAAVTLLYWTPHSQKDQPSPASTLLLTQKCKELGSLRLNIKPCSSLRPAAILFPGLLPQSSCKPASRDIWPSGARVPSCLEHLYPQLFLHLSTWYPPGPGPCPEKKLHDFMTYLANANCLPAYTSTCHWTLRPH